MFKKIKQYINLYKEVKRLEKKVNYLKGNAGAVIEGYMKRQPKPLDLSKFQQDELFDYYNKAKEALSNIALKNEIRNIIEDQQEFALTQSENYEDVLKARYIILAYKLLEDKLNNIYDPRSTDNTKNEELIQI